MDRVGPSKADKSLTTRWLAEHWGGIPTTAAAPAAAAAAAGRQWPTLQPRQATARDGDPGLEQAAQPGAATWDGTGGGRARRAARRLEKGTLCEALARQYGVVPHATWGTLPDDQHGTWASLRCDERLQGDAADSVASNRKDTGASHGEARQECSWLRLEHAVQVGQSWGTLSTEQRARWTQLSCIPSEGHGFGGWLAQVDPRGAEELAQCRTRLRRAWRCRWRTGYGSDWIGVRCRPACSGGGQYLGVTLWSTEQLGAPAPGLR